MQMVINRAAITGSELAPPSYVQIRNRRFPFTTYAEASAAYRATIDHLGLGCSQSPMCTIHDGTGRVVANVAYNGRVFAAGTEEVLFETRVAR